MPLAAPTSAEIKKIANKPRIIVKGVPFFSSSCCDVSVIIDEAIKIMFEKEKAIDNKEDRLYLCCNA